MIAWREDHSIIVSASCMESAHQNCMHVAHQWKLDLHVVLLYIANGLRTEHTIPAMSTYNYRTLAKIRPPFSARSLGLLGDWEFNREQRVFIRTYAHPQPQIEVTLCYANSLCIFT